MDFSTFLNSRFVFNSYPRVWSMVRAIFKQDRAQSICWRWSFCMCLMSDNLSYVLQFSLPFLFKMGCEADDTFFKFLPFSQVRVKASKVLTKTFSFSFRVSKFFIQFSIKWSADFFSFFRYLCGKLNQLISKTFE